MAITIYVAGPFFPRRLSRAVCAFVLEVCTSAVRVHGRICFVGAWTNGSKRFRDIRRSLFFGSNHKRDELTKNQLLHIAHLDFSHSTADEANLISRACTQTTTSSASRQSTTHRCEMQVSFEAMRDLKRGLAGTRLE